MHTDTRTHTHRLAHARTRAKTHTHTHARTHAHAQTLVAYQGNETEEKVFKKKGFQGRFKVADRGRMADRNRELVPDNITITVVSARTPRINCLIDNCFVFTLSQPWRLYHCEQQDLYIYI